MLSFRNARKEDAENIAKLHAKSWQSAYKGILSDEYLANNVLKNRLETWQKRFENPKENQYIILVKENDILLGFVCIFGNQDTEYGSLTQLAFSPPKSSQKGINFCLFSLFFTFF